MEAFAFDLRNKKVRAKSTPQGLLLGILNSGRSYVSSDYIEALSKDVSEARKRVQEVESLRSEQIELQSLIAFEEFRKTVSEDNLLLIVPRLEAVPTSIWERLVKQAFLDGRFNERKGPLEEN